MKKLLALSVIGTSFFITSTPLRADTFYGADYLRNGDERYIEVFSFDNETNIKTKLGSYLYSTDAEATYINDFTPATSPYSAKQFNAADGKIIIYGSTNASPNQPGKYIEFDVSEKTWSEIQDVTGENSTFSPVMTTGWATKNNVTSNSSNISSNDTDIAANASNISSNDTDIAANASNISSNDTDIAANASNISSNDTDIAANASNISSNDTDIAANASNISSNDTDIASNASNISSNDTDIASNASNISSNDTDISALQGLISTKSGSTTTARIGDSTKNTLEIGPTTNPTTIDQSGISVSGGNLIKKDSDGNIHIGKNSFVIGDDVLNGAHPIWAEDENGTKIPLNIYGSDLHINGKSVQGQIDSNKSNIKNLGEGVAGSTALTAALSALPQTSKESKLSCGVGTGAYSSRYAVGFGCASKVNKRVDINAGGSYVFGGSKSYGGGTLDSGVVKAGFVFKLGELNKPTQISMKDKKVMETKIGTLTNKNEKLQNKVSTLMARLERLEKIASRDINSQDLALIKN